MNQAAWIAVGSLLVMLAGFIGNEVRTRRRELASEVGTRRRELADVRGRLDICEAVRSDLLGELNDDRIKHRGEIVHFEGEIRHLTEKNDELRGLVMGEKVPPAMQALIQTAVNGVNETADERARRALREVLARLERIEDAVKGSP